MEEIGPIDFTEEEKEFARKINENFPKEAIEANREWIFHADIKAAAWLTALKKLTSAETVAKELLINSGKRRKSVTKKRLMLIDSNSEQPT